MNKTLSIFVAAAWLAGGVSAAYASDSGHASPAMLSADGHQEKTQVTGHVNDSDGEPLIGATVRVANSSTVAVTDIDGNFSITAPEGSTLEISYVGYKPFKTKVMKGKPVNVTLEADNTILDDVIVVGYSTTTPRLSSTAVTKIDNEKSIKVPFSDMTSTLQGRVPGVIVVQGSAEPGQNGASISIRGNGTPLFVIDGFVSTAAQFNRLNKADIESMTVLKDAASTAVYGMNAGNGVIVVTTKQGTAGKLSVNYQANFAWNSESYTPDRMNAYEYATAVNKLWSATGNGLYAFKNADELADIRTHLGDYTNWEHEILRKNAPQSEHTISMSGGNEKVNLFTSLNYLDQRSIFKADRTNMQRYNYRVTGTGNFENIGLKVRMGANGQLFDENYPIESAWTIFSRVKDRTPFERPYNDDGTISNQFDNPALILGSPGEIKLRTVYNQVTAALTWSLPWVKGLSVGFDGNYNHTSQDRKDWLEKATYYDAEGNANPQAPTDISISRSAYSQHRYDYNFRIDYNNKFGLNSIGATLVFNRQYYHGYDLSTGSNTFYTSAIQLVQKGDAASIWGSSGEAEEASEGYVGRLTYNYDEKYIAEFSGRYDGSDCFPKGDRYGFFPSFSLAWVPTREKFASALVDLGIFDFLKVRGSYGEVGINGPKVNGTHGSYAYLTTFNYNNNAYVFDGQLVNSLTPGATPSINMTWYRRKKTDIGVDFATLHSRLSGSIDYFYETTKGYLVSPAYDFVDPIGYSLPQIVSDAEDRQQGIDASLKYSDTFGRDFSFSAGFNCTWYQSYSFKTNETKEALGNPWTRTQGTYRDFLTTGYIGTKIYTDPEQILNNPRRETSKDLRPGDLWYQDLNGDGKIDGQDQRRYGNSSSPRFIYGFDFTLGWKGFSLYANFQGIGKAQRLMGSFPQAQEGERRLDFQYQLDTWAPDNLDARFPRSTNNSVNNGNNFAGSDWWAQDIHYFRLKSLSLSYNFKDYLLRRCNWIANATIFVSGVNLFAIGPSVKYSDPEATTFDSYNYPMMRTYSVGLQLGF